MITAALSPMTLAIHALYGMGKAAQAALDTTQVVNDFLNRHIADLKQSDNPTVASTGRVLEAAKLGFGLGYIGSVAIIATGQLLLGNHLAALGVVAAGVTLTNPIAMTCAALGAIYYGWGALTDKERAAILERLSVGLNMGVELIKSLVDFVVRKTQEFLSSKQLAQFKDFIQTQAAQFGKSLYDVTHAMGDWVKGVADKAGDLAGQAADITSVTARKTADFASDAAGKVADSATDVAQVITGKFRGQENLLPNPNSSSFTPQALKHWESIPREVRPLLLSNVWCADCRQETTIAQFTGRIQRGDLILTGQCSQCQGEVARVVEGD